jgi:copper chaperone
MSTQDRTLTIDGMHCDHCVDTVEEVLADLDGVTVRSVDIGSAEVSVDADAVSDDEIAAVLDGAGYALSA